MYGIKLHITWLSKCHRIILVGYLTSAPIRLLYARRIFSRLKILMLSNIERLQRWDDVDILNLPWADIGRGSFFLLWVLSAAYSFNIKLPMYDKSYITYVESNKVTKRKSLLYTMNRQLYVYNVYWYVFRVFTYSIDMKVIPTWYGSTLKSVLIFKMYVVLKMPLSLWRLYVYHVIYRYRGWFFYVGYTINVNIARDDSLHRRPSNLIRNSRVSKRFCCSGCFNNVQHQIDVDKT